MDNPNRDLEDYSKTYLGPFESIQVNYRRWKVLEGIRENGAKNILEVGCGKDSVVNYLSKLEYDKFHIVEPIKEFLLNAVKVKSDKVICHNDFIENLPGLGEFNFDFIIISGLLHEVKDPLKLMECIHKISRISTIVHVNVPNANSFHRLLALEMGIIDSVYDISENQIKLQQNHTFDIDSLSNLCQRSGFTIKEKGSILIKPFTHYQMQKIVDYGIIDINILDGLYRMTKYMPELGSEIFLNLIKNNHQLSDIENNRV